MNDKCYEATPDEICDTLLRDYRRISGEAMHWSSGIEHSIECYRKFKKGELVSKGLNESYPKHWKYLILHYNPQTEELHIDGDRGYSSSILVSFVKREIRGDISPSPQGKELDDTNKDRICKEKPDKLTIAVSALEKIIDYAKDDLEESYNEEILGIAKQSLDRLAEGQDK